MITAVTPPFDPRSEKGFTAKLYLYRTEDDFSFCADQTPHSDRLLSSPGRDKSAPAMSTVGAN